MPLSGLTCHLRISDFVLPVVSTRALNMNSPLPKPYEPCQRASSNGAGEVHQSGTPGCPGTPPPGGKHVDCARASPATSTSPNPTLANASHALRCTEVDMRSPEVRGERARVRC